MSFFEYAITKNHHFVTAFRLFVICQLDRCNTITIMVEYLPVYVAMITVTIKIDTGTVLHDKRDEILTAGSPPSRE